MQWSMPVIWLIACIVLGVLEAATTQLVTIWFALGALVALIASAFHAPLWLQAALFVLVSVAALLLTRPLVRRRLNGRKIPTNADRVIGQTCVVQQEIDNAKAQGTVTVDGAVWTARSDDGAVIESGARVQALRIEGVKLIVQKINQ